MTSSGIENSFKFPFPFTCTVACKDSEAFSVFLVVITSNSNAPTAPLKLLGFPSSGNGKTVSVRFPAVIVRDTWV